MQNKDSNKKTERVIISFIKHMSIVWNGRPSATREQTANSLLWKGLHGSQVIFKLCSLGVFISLTLLNSSQLFLPTQTSDYIMTQGKNDSVEERNRDVQTLCLSDCLHTELPEMDSHTMISHNVCVDVGCRMQLAKKKFSFHYWKETIAVWSKDTLDAAQTNLTY